MKKNKFKNFKGKHGLDGILAIEAYMEKALMTGNVNNIASSLGDIAKTKGMAEISKKTGLAREQLYNSFGQKGSPTLNTFLLVSKALNITLTVKKNKETKNEKT